MLNRLPSLFVAALLLLLSGCDQPPISPLRLGTNVWPGYEPLYLARAKGYLESEQVLLVEYANSSDVLRGLLNNVLDAGALTLDEALSLASQRGASDFAIFHVADFSNGADAILARPPIRTLADLAGAKVGYEVTALGSYFLRRALEQADLTLADVQAVNVEVDDQFNAWQRGELDAVITFDPVKTRIQRAGGTEVFSSRDIPGEIVDVLVMRKDLLQGRSDTVRHIIDAWFSAVALMARDPDEANRVLDLRLRLGPEAIIDAYEGLHIPSRSAVARLLLGPEPELLESARTMQEIMLSEGLLEHMVVPEDMFVAVIPGLE